MYMAQNNIRHYKENSQSGFALLMTLVVVSVIISIGVSVLDLSVKQVRLSTNAKESEAAFHAANAAAYAANGCRPCSQGVRIADLKSTV